MESPRISACVIAFNEQDCIAACLQSLAQVADELVVVDSHSTDATRRIAAECGARVIERDWPGYRSQRQFAIDAAAHDWVLMLDADEQLSPELVAELQRWKAAPPAAAAAYSLPFRSRYFGRTLRFGDTGREHHVRFVDRRRAAMGGFEIHEKIVAQGPIERMRGRVLHDSYRSLDDQSTKLARYAALMADAMHAAGRRGSVVALLVNPSWRFLRAWLLRGGIFDGWRGFVMAMQDANYVRQKYLRLLVLSRTDARIR
jgi:glycosyltransferase involved in cell wall biosynthesis